MAHIPLRTLDSSSLPTDEHSAALLSEKRGNRRSADSAGSDFSLWSDTGDLAEQLADEEDPLRIRLQQSVDDRGLRTSVSSPLHRRPKHVHYSKDNHLEHKTTNPGLTKEAIEIPNPPARQIGRTEKALAIIMTGDRRRSQVHGLTGKPLLYVSLPRSAQYMILIGYRYFTSVFVSLGVFLFGYDQGVMSGIIT